MATEIEWAWFAGIFEGEGTIVFTGQTSVVLRVGMTDEDVILRLDRIAGEFGKVLGPYTKNRAKALWSWRASKRCDVEAVLDRIEPYLASRRGQRAKDARERLASCRPKQWCKRGHEFTPENTYTHSDQRVCRKCALARAEKWRRRQKENRMQTVTVSPA